MAEPVADTLPIEPRQSDDGLLRAIGPLGLGASVVNIVVGGTIFVLPAVLARLLGAATPVAYLTGAVIMGLVTLSFAEGGRRTARSGGPYAYVESAFGRFPGYLTGLLCGLAGVLSSGAVAAALVDALSTVAAPLTRPGPRGATMILIYVVLTAVNLRGVRAGTTLATSAAAAKFGGLLLFVVAGSRYVELDNIGWALPSDLSQLGRATILVIFAFAGMEVPLGAGGEIRDPRRTVPRALGGALLLVVLLYISIQIVAQGVLGPAIADSKAPLADAIAQVSSAGRGFMLATGSISMLGFLAGDMLGNSRILFAFGRDGLLPRQLAAIHPVTRAPYKAVLTYASLGCALGITGTFTVLAPMSSLAIILLYIACCAAAWLLSRRTARERMARRSDLTLLAPPLAIVALLWVMAHSTRSEVLAVVAVLAIASVIYWLMARVSSLRNN